MKTKGYKTYFEVLYILFLGVITSFSLTPYNYWFLNFFTFSLLLIFLINKKSENLKSFFIYGYIFGFGYFFSSLYWIPISLSYDENFSFLIPFAIIIIPTVLSLFYGFAFLTFKYFYNYKGIFLNLLLFSLILGIYEFLRGKLFSGFPWNLFAYSFLENINFIQINSIIGIYSFNMFLITLFSLPSIFFLDKKKNDLFGLLLILAISSISYVYGVYKIHNFQKLKTETLSSEIKILSTNVPINRFYSIMDNEKILKKLINLSNPDHNLKTIFIWPEGVIPNTDLKTLQNDYDFLFKNSFSENHNIILGVNDSKIINKKKYFFNSLSIIDNDINVIFKYYKKNLVPFGEFLPFENILSKIGLRSLTNNYQSYSSGDERKIFHFKNHDKIKILPLICYEIIYSGELLKFNDYNFIVNISEDGWFGNSIGPHQHFAHSIFRSIEYGKYTLRSANNGISAIIDPKGSIIKKIDINSEGVLTIKEIANVDKTPFSILGNKIYLLIILLYIFLIFSFKKIGNE